MKKEINIGVTFLLVLFFNACRSMPGGFASKSEAIKIEKEGARSKSMPLSEPSPVVVDGAPAPLDSKSTTKSTIEVGIPLPKESKVYEDKKSSTGLKAGFQDDNKQYNYFLEFLSKYRQNTTNIPLDIFERITFKIIDKENRPIFNAKVVVKEEGRVLKEGLTYSDGSFLFFPSEYANRNYNYEVEAFFNNTSKKITVSPKTKRVKEIKLNSSMEIQDDIPLDILFIFDTTGSMGEEISRLKTTLELIYLNISNLKLKVKPRFGMVLYKDKNDDYITKIIPLTDDVAKFQDQLNKLVTASGGGDLPEDLQSALKDSLLNIKWNKNGLRLSFIITDASAHLDYNQKYTYINASKDAAKNAIKIYSIGTGGLDINGEYILRQISQYTNAKYVFLTYGEKGDSEGGKASSVSHHTGANFQTDKLEAIIIKFIKEEISNILGKKIEDDDYFEATKIDDEEKEETLRELFDKALSQLVDYSSIQIDENTTFSILPIKSNANQNLKINAEYLGEQLLLNARENKKLKLVERKDLQKIISEMKLQDSGLVDEKTTVKLGKITGAKYLLVSNLYKKKNRFELFMKLVKVENAEVVSVTKSYIDESLGVK